MTSNESNESSGNGMVRRVSDNNNNRFHHQPTQQLLPESFPIKLHRILEDAESKAFKDVVSWIPSNNGFKVHEPKAFEDNIMPNYFNNTKYKSFQRQLNMWNFERQNSSGPNLNLTPMMKSSSPSGTGIDAACPPKGSYLHPCFIRGKPELCQKMERIKIKGILSKKKRKSSNSAAAATTTVAAVTNNESLILAQSRVAQLQRKKEEIERKLSSITQQMENFPPNHDHIDSANAATNPISFSSRHLPRVSYNSNMDIDDTGATSTSMVNSCIKRRGSIGSIGSIGGGNGLIRCSSIDTIQSLLGEGDSLCFEGKTFHFVDHQAAPNSNDHWGVTPSSSSYSSSSGQHHQPQERRRSVGRRYSLELVDSESDEYVLKELEEAIELGTGIFGGATATGSATTDANDDGDRNLPNSGGSSSKQNQNIPFVDTQSTYKPLSLSHRVSLQDQSNGNNNNSSKTANNNNNDNSITTIPFSIPTKLNNYVQGATSSSRRSGSKKKKKGENFISNNMPLFHLNLDRPKRRFSLTSTSVHDPFENNNLREIYNKLQEEQQQQPHPKARRTSAEKIASNFFPSSSNAAASATTATISARRGGVVVDSGNKMSPRVSF